MKQAAFNTIFVILMTIAIVSMAITFSTTQHQIIANIVGVTSSLGIAFLIIRYGLEPCED